MPRKKISMEDPELTRALGILNEAASDVELFTEYVALVGGYKKLLRKFNKTVIISDSYESQLQDISRKLEETAQKYIQLKNVALPICMYCKKIRSDNDYWQQLETFFSSHVDIMFSHGICPDCIKNAYDKMGLPRKAAISGDSAIVPPATPAGREPAEDEALREMRALVRQSAFDGNPLSPKVEQFVEKYGKLLRRFNKIVSIGDSYQSQLMELKSRLELMARTDLLTGLANRWEMTARLDAEKSRSERHGKNFSILLADIDYFKNINDTHGHLAGDRMLRALADTLRVSLRGEDICSRWGGEEFLVILPETDLRKAGSVAEKLLKKVRNTSVQWEGQSIRATMSIGYGVFVPGMSIDRFIRQVDEALYNAKAAGRDRIATVENQKTQSPDSRSE
ncbi:MAG: diguanylate cyclase [Desulfuromonadales bacterium]